MRVSNIYMKDFSNMPRNSKRGKFSKIQIASIKNKLIAAFAAQVYSVLDGKSKAAAKTRAIESMEGIPYIVVSEVLNVVLIYFFVILELFRLFYNFFNIVSKA